MDKKKKVAILGTVAHYALAPFDDESFEIWGINDLYLSEGVKRWDRWFQLHHPGYYTGRGAGATYEEMLATYSKWDCPVYLFQKHPQIANSLAFPYEKLVKEFGDYFNNTISWIIAFAIHEGFKEIHIYGVDMSTHSEYGTQRPSCEYFLGLARGRGIKVYIPPESTLLKTRFLYGYEAEQKSAYEKQLQLRKQFAIAKHDDHAKEEENHQNMKNQYMGAAMVVEEILKDL